MNYKKQAIMNTIGNITSLFSQWLIVLLLPRMGGFVEAGVFSLAISITSIFGVVATFNMRSYQVTDGYILETEGEFFLSRLLTICLSIFTCICYLGIAGYSPAQTYTIIAYLFYKSLLALADIYVGTLQINDRLDLAGFGSLGEGIISGFIFFIVYSKTENLFLSVFFMAISGGVFYIVFVVYYSQKVKVQSSRAHKSLKNALKIIKICIPLCLAAVFPILLNALPKILLQRHGGDEVVGIFSSLSAPTIVIITMASGLFAPLVTIFSTLERSNKYKEFRNKFVIIFVVLCILGIFCFGLGLLIGPKFFSWLYGEEILIHIRIFYNLICAVVFCAMTSYSGIILVTLGRLNFVAITSFMALAVGSVAYLFLIPTHGMMGAACGLLIAYLTQVIIQVIGIFIFIAGKIKNGV